MSRYRSVVHSAIRCVVVAALAADSLLAQASPTLRPCTVPGLTGDVRCGSVRVPEDRAHPDRRQLDLRVVVARATGQRRAPDPFVLLAGGPGQAGTEMGGFATVAFSLVREQRDLVLVDMRGTGRTGGLHCAMMRRPEDLGEWTIYPAPSVRWCRDSLSAIADLSRYTTADLADDLEAVRAALGYPRLNLYGTSYGSRLSLAYMRRHPSSVRAVVLKAVAPPTLVAPMNYAADAERAFGLLVRDCRADSACARAYPSPRADLDTLLGRAERGEVVAAVPAPNGRSDTVRVSRDAIAALLVNMMQSAGQRALLPRILHAGVLGDVQPLVDALVQTRRAIDAGIAIGMHLSVACSEDGPRLDTTTARTDDRRTFLGASRVRMLAEACRVWNVPPAPREAATAVRSEAPVLLVSGELDPNTPARHAEEALATLPNGRHIVLAGVAHGWTNSAACGAAFVAAFVERASADGLDVACGKVSSAPRFVVSGSARP